MKKVFSSNSELCHVFAQRSQSEGNVNSWNLYFEYDKIYSYGSHYLLAEFMADGQYIIINNEGYSNSTSKHISLIIGATNHYKQFYTMLSDINNVYSSIKMATDKLARARKPEIYIKDILYRFNALNEFIDYTINKTIKKTDKYKELKRIVKLISNNFTGYKAKLLKLDQANKKKAKKLEAKRLKDDLHDFMSYNSHYMRTKQAYVRLSKDSQTIETSQGANVPVKAAKLLYKMILAGKDIKGHEIGYYTVISINGTLIIGCHEINIDSMHKVGKLISLPAIMKLAL